MLDPMNTNEEFAPLPIVEGGFQTVLADPPWRFTNRTGKVAPEHHRLGVRHDVAGRDQGSAGG